MRYFVEIAYHGKHYFGFQRQPNQISVQEVLENSLSTLLRTEIKIVGAGRTDTGVHAKQLFAHFDFEEIKTEDNLIHRLNSFLPKDIAVRNIIPVKDDAHARFDAVGREYQYLISLEKDPFLEDFAFTIHKLPVLDLMNRAAERLLYHVNFQCFSRSRTDVKTYNCKIKEASWRRTENKLIFTIIADRFLRNMVRAIVGTLLDVGWERTSLDQFQDILDSKSREKAGASAPAKGLYLTKVEYPKAIFKES